MSENTSDEDFDLEAFIDLFDTAMSSENPAVKKALKNLLMISTLVNSEKPLQDQVMGPLRQMRNTMFDITRRIDNLERNSERSYTYATSHLPTTGGNFFRWDNINPATGFIARPVPGTLLRDDNENDYDN